MKGGCWGLKSLPESGWKNTIIGLGGAATVGKEKEERKLERESDLRLLGAK